MCRLKKILSLIALQVYEIFGLGGWLLYTLLHDKVLKSFLVILYLERL